VSVNVLEQHHNDPEEHFQKAPFFLLPLFFFFSAFQQVEEMDKEKGLKEMIRKRSSLGDSGSRSTEKGTAARKQRGGARFPANVRANITTAASRVHLLKALSSFPLYS
jgi:hypothetical protein